MEVYLELRYSTIRYKGHVITLLHDVQNIADILPHSLPSELPVITFSAKGRDNICHNFKECGDKVLNALL